MDWITFRPHGIFYSFFAVQGEGRLSSQLAHPDEVDHAVKELKRQLDLEAKRLKKELARPRAERIAALRDA